MNRKRRVAKTTSEKIRDLDDQVFLLRKTLREIRTDTAHVKTLAAALRSLVCYSSGTEGLLWRLCDELGVNDEVFIHTHGGLDPDHPLARGMKMAVLPLARGGHLPANAPSPENVPLRTVIKEDEAVFADGRSLTHEELIKGVSQQLGLAHESDDVDPELRTLGRVRLQNAETYVHILVQEAEFVLEVAERVLDKAEEEKGYRRKIRTAPAGEFALVVRVRFLNQVASAIPVGGLHTFSGMRITYSAYPSSWAFIAERNSASDEFVVPYPGGLVKNHESAVFSFEYRSSHRDVRVGINGDFQDPIQCDLGWLEAIDIVNREEFPEPTGIIEGGWVAIFDGLMDSERLKAIKDSRPPGL